MEYIEVKSAKTNNLKSVDVRIPLNSITTVCGPSGSGKSSLAFHTLLAESTRRFVNSFPAKMRLFFDIPSRVEVDSISPVLPAFGLPQNNPIINSRYNVLEHIDGLNSLLKIFFVKGVDYCRKHDSGFESQNLGDALTSFVENIKPKDDDIIRIFLSVYKHEDIFESGPTPSKSVSNEIKEIADFDEEHQFWEIFKIKGKSVSRVAKKLNEIISDSTNEIYGVVSCNNKKIELFHLFRGEVCKKGGEVKKISVETLDHISPLNAMGACDKCGGHGMLLEYDRLKMVKNPNLSIKEGAIQTLKHSRISHHSRSFLMGLKKEGINLDKPFYKITESEWDKIWNGSKTRDGLKDLIKYLEAKRYKSTIRIYLRGIQSEYPCGECNSSALSEHAGSRFVKAGTKKVFMSDLISSSLDEMNQILSKLTGPEFKDVAYPVRDLKKKLSICIDMGLGHLSGTRKVRSLSSGEYQRLLLVKYLSYQGEGSLFVLDEPSLGLGLQEQKSLFKYIKELKKQGNTILMVEHSDFFIKNSDHLITMGPGAGLHGGEVLPSTKSSNAKKIAFKKTTAVPSKVPYLEVNKLSIFDAKAISFKLPKGLITWVNGDSGTGKSLYLVKSLAEYLNRMSGDGGVYDPSIALGSTKGFDDIESIKVFDGSMGGISSRSTISTYLDIASSLRKYYSSLPVSKSLNLRDGHFSSNSDLGKCPTCEGKGSVEVDMTYFEDVDLVCEDCNGMKMRPYLAKISDGEHSFYETINLPLDVAFSKIKLTPKYRKLYERLELLNLSHLNPDRKINTLSGGERLRIKLLSSLQKKLENSLLIFENISFGLSKKELLGLSSMIETLMASNNTILIIDQNEWFKDVAHFQLSFKGLGVNPKLAKI